MQFTTNFAFAAVLVALSSPLAVAQAPASSYADPNPNYSQLQPYCVCVGIPGGPDYVPNNEYTAKVCNAWQGGNLVDAGTFLQCDGVHPVGLDSFAKYCASYGPTSARGAKCCDSNQEWQYCPIKLFGQI